MRFSLTCNINCPYDGVSGKHRIAGSDENTEFWILSWSGISCCST